jgi:hypothetical protein
MLLLKKGDLFTLDCAFWGHFEQFNNLMALNSLICLELLFGYKMLLLRRFFRDF